MKTNATLSRRRLLASIPAVAAASAIIRILGCLAAPVTIDVLRWQSFYDGHLPEWS